MHALSPSWVWHKLLHKNHQEKPPYLWRLWRPFGTQPPTTKVAEVLKVYQSFSECLRVLQSRPSASKPPSEQILEGCCSPLDDVAMIAVHCPFSIVPELYALLW